MLGQPDGKKDRLKKAAADWMSFLIFLFSYQAVREIAVSAGAKPAPLPSPCALLLQCQERGRLQREAGDRGNLVFVSGAGDRATANTRGRELCFRAVPVTSHKGEKGLISQCQTQIT